MTRKLAIAISGAVSLGSYEAGVMYEVLEAIAVHNENLPENDDKRIEIDVITGASAGGMTAGMLVQHLLCGDGTLRDPYNNPLYKSWVEDVDIVPLLCEVKKEEQQFSLLSSSVVEDIGGKYILGIPTNPSNLHLAASSTIRVGIAMSNLNGFNYYISSKQKTQHIMNEFAYTQYKDQFVCIASRAASGEVTLKEKVLELDETTNKESWIDTGDRDWGELRDIAISSGAFPFAFQAKAIHRDRVGRFASKTGTYLYTDGGIFENEPIGLAKSLADQTEQNSNSSDRYYLFIAPGQRQANNSSLKKGEDNLLTTGIALLNAIFGQSQFQGWIMDNLNSTVYSITATDTQLIGDVFSAFSGFLEEKFRAYDYNIGRENARSKLLEARENGLLTYDLMNMSAIEWKVKGEKGKIGGRDVKSWEEVKILLGKLAETRIDEKTGTRDQLKELQSLMHEVNEDTRKKIAEQLISRLDYLINFINDHYLKPLDEKNNGSFFSKLGSWFKMALRTWIGRPITKFVLWLFLKTWLEKNILYPPVYENS